MSLTIHSATSKQNANDGRAANAASDANEQHELCEACRDALQISRGCGACTTTTTALV